MSGKILRRCSVCGKFHASYLVPDHPGGKGYYCSSCWHALRAPKPPGQAAPAQSDAAAAQAADAEKPPRVP